MLRERRWLKIQDFLTFRPLAIEDNKRFLWECKDSKTETGHSLLVKVAATHAGIVTGNRKFYRPDCMQASVNTWVPEGFPPLPVLRGHDKEGEVLGRIREAKYIDDSWKYAKDFPVLKQSAFYCEDKLNRKLDLFKSISWIQDNLARRKDYHGLGHVELGLTLTNPKAIQSVLRDEYLCVSAGMITDAAICSICHTDWSSEDKCDHNPGQIVDGRMAFLISGRFKARELSFVNFGADPFAQVKSYELKDSLEKMFFLGLPLDDQKQAIDRGLVLTDSLYESDIAIEYEEPTMAFDAAAAEKTLKDSALTAAQAFELQDQLGAWHPEEDAEKTQKRSFTASLTAKIRKNGWKREEGQATATEIADTELAAVPAVEDTAVADAVAEAEGAKPAEKIEDKAAETKVEDAPNTGAAKTEPAATEVEISDELKALATTAKLIEDAEGKETSPQAKEVLALYASLDKIHKAAAGDKNGLQWRIEDLHSSLSDYWNRERSLTWAKQYLAEHVKDSLVIPKSELADKEDALNGLNEEVTALKDTLATKSKSLAAVFTDSKRSLATTVVMHKVLAKKDGFTGLNPTQIEDKITEFSKRHIQSLKDAVADIFTELQWTKTQAAEPAAASTDSATTVNDNAHVDPEVESTAAEAAQATTVLDTKDADRLLSYITDPRERERMRFKIRRQR